MSEGKKLDAAELSANPAPPVCLRCELPRPDESITPHVLYCEACAVYFREDQHLRRKGVIGRNTFAEPAGTRVAPGSRPITSKDAQTKTVHCGLCGSGRVSSEYGHCIYGCGAHDVCEDCGAVLDFIEDKGD